MLSWNGIDVYHQIRECRPALPSKPYVGAATGENNLHIGANRTHQRGDSISMNSLLSGAVGEDIRYESRTSIACAMVSEGVTRAERTCLELDQIIIARAHIVYHQLPCTFVLRREFYRALNELCDRLPLSTRRLYKRPLPSRWLWTFILTVRNDTGLDLILHKR